MDIRLFAMRVAGPQEAALIASLSRSTFYDTFAAVNTAENMSIFLNEQFTTDSLISEVSVSSNIFLLAFYDEQPAGYVKMRKQQVPRALGNVTAIEIARIYLVKDFIGSGLGKCMMQYVVDLAKNMEYEAIWLAVWEKNERAIRFYENWGFKKFDQQVFVLGRDFQKDWMMVKKL